MRITSGDYLADWPQLADSQHACTLPEIIAAAVAVSPDDPAVFDGGQQRTWQDWQAEALALASGLQELGIGIGDVVAVCLPNSWEFLVAHVAIAEIGAVMLPLHVALGRREQVSLLRRTGARVLIASALPGGHAQTATPAAGSLLPEAPELEHLLAAGSGPLAPGTWSLASVTASRQGWRPDAVALTPDAPFVLLPSSGTTSARPKICVHTHGGLLSNAAIVAADGQALGDDMLVSASPFTHLFGLLSIHLSLIVRGRQALLPEWDVAALAALARNNSGATVLFAVPAQLRDMVSRLSDSAAAEGVPAVPPIRLREVRTGGTAVPAGLVADLERLTGARTTVQWGMSEVGAGTFTRPADPQEVATRSIGRPVTGSKARIVDAEGQPCPPGQVGQLQYRGAHLFRGYLGEPELTRAALTWDGWLRTADLASWNEDGTIAYRGRDAEIINVGGVKFSASEIENLLSDLPQLATLAVAGRPDARLGEYPCLLVTVRPGAAITLDEVNAHLAGKGVARYKWPLELITVDEIPVTPTRKVARGLLAALLERHPAPGSLNDHGPLNGPGTLPWREQLAGLSEAEQLRAALQLVGDQASAVSGGSAATVDPDRSFRDCGADSATAVRLAAALSAQTGEPLPTTVSFDYPTPRALAAHLVARVRRQAVGPDAPGEPGQVPDEPVAIVGMACRFPAGIDSPDDLWQVVAQGRDVISEFPADRGWDLSGLIDADPDRPGKSYVCRGGFVDGVAGFDAPFFGISPREAAAMDPQQRLLLETSWEALERAGIDPLSMRGSATSVFAGVMSADYAARVHEAPERFGGYILTGNAACMASGRVSYVLGLTGPALTVDTACSSSLVALHLAVSSLRQGECSMALAGGATVMATPASFVEFSRQRALAPDSRCKAFAAAADGAVWAEGAGMLVLERLSDARRHGHEVLAVIRGSAINQDGRSNGLTAPNGLSQQEVIRRALASAGLSAGDVDVVEAHGTGTALGDPIEAGALLAAYGRSRDSGRPLWLGSVKSNIGHTQAAAGVAGVIKVVMAMRHSLLPATIHVDAPSPHVDWSAGDVRLLTEPQPWPRCARPRAAGVSAFGISGTNAHMILQEAEPAPASSGGQASDDKAFLPWILSARSPAALRSMSGRLAAAGAVTRTPGRADTDRADAELMEAGLGDIAQALISSRSQFEHRAVVIGRHRCDFTDGLNALADGAPDSGVVTGVSHEGKTVFVFPGQGPQWPGMAAGLLEASPVFAEAMSACEQALAPYLDWSLLSALRGEPGQPPADRVDVTQVTLFAVMVSLAALWRSLGVRPDAVIGHSQGEVAAAHVAGALSLEDAAVVAARRGSALRRLDSGAMASLAVAEDELADIIARWTGRLWVAAVNGPRSAVVSGVGDAVAAVVAELAAAGIRARLIPVSYASHSPHVAAIKDTLSTELAGLKPHRSEVPLYSTVTGAWLDTTTMTAAYWYRNLRQSVRFGPAVNALLSEGNSHFIEVSPHPVLTYDIRATAESVGAAALAVGSLRRDDGGLRRFLLSAGEAWAHGVSVDWSATLAQQQAAHVDLPTYPFQRQVYWLAPSQARPSGATGAQARQPSTTAESGSSGAQGAANAVQPGGQGQSRAALPQGEAGVLDLVRAQAAAVLEYGNPAAMPADQTFAELGYDSLTAAELWRRLTTTLGLQLPSAVVFDYPTPAQLSRYLWERLSAAADLSPGLDIDAAVAAVYWHTRQAGHDSASMEILKQLSALRPAYGPKDCKLRAPAAVPLAGSAAAPALACFPSAVPMGGPHEYVALARSLQGIGNVFALPQPGFVAGEHLPDSLPALVGTHVEAIAQLGGPESLVLCGHSSGGLIAQAVADRLESIGLGPAGLVLIDTYWPDGDFLSKALPRVLSAAADHDGQLAPVEASAVRLTATGGYLRLLDGWQPPAIKTPVLFLRAQDPVPGLPPDLRARWPLPHTLSTVPGNHLTMLGAHAPATAAAIESWLGRAPGGMDDGPARGGFSDRRRVHAP
jgi:acyl transferase domain-containing protein/acyl-CoA synthetase (AMP-forming)/AMP-acid ligase II